MCRDKWINEHQIRGGGRERGGFVEATSLETYCTLQVQVQVQFRSVQSNPIQSNPVQSSTTQLSKAQCNTTTASSTTATTTTDGGFYCHRSVIGAELAESCFYIFPTSHFPLPKLALHHSGFRLQAQPRADWERASNFSERGQR